MTTQRIDDRQEIADVLHDLSQPLAAIRALASVPSAGAADWPSELSDRLRRIGELGDWMSDLLQTGRGAAAAAPAAADLTSAVEEVVLTAAVSFDGSLSWQPAERVEVPVGPADLRRALGNVVDNAVRAAGPGGQVSVRVRPRQHGVCVEVEDSGPGLGRIPAQTGRGLGVTRSVLDRAGGRLTLESRRSGGVRVRLVFPAITAGRSA